MAFLSGLQGKALYRAASACCGAAFMLYGWDAGVLGGIQSTPQFREAIGNPTGAFIIPIIASVYNLAAGVMSLCVTLFGMQLGRKRTILLGDLFICIGAVLQASTYSVGQVILHYPQRSIKTIADHWPQDHCRTHRLWLRNWLHR